MLDKQTEEKLRGLGLTGMLSAYKAQLESPQMLKLSFNERLGMILDSEVSDREAKRLERLKRNARLRQTTASIEDIDYNPLRKLDSSVIMNLVDCNWIARQQNLILTGATGTGKSWLACAFGNQACRKGYSTMYSTAAQLFEDLYRAYRDQSLPKLRKKIVSTDLLIVDDFGIGTIDDVIGPSLLDIIDQQGINGSLIITSQYPTSKWHSLIADKTLADAILDRIINKAHMIPLKGDSMRRSQKKL